jgi:hypothetical protein
MALDENKLHEFLGRALMDLGGGVNAVLMSIGDELGLYKLSLRARRRLLNSRATQRQTNATFASGSIAKWLAAMSPTINRPASTFLARSRSFAWPTRMGLSTCRVQAC